MEPGTPKEKVLLMLQKLLADRFKLIVVRESRQSQTYALTVAPGGPKLEKAASETEGGNYILRGRIEGARMPIGMLAESLTSITKVPVMNETGLSGLYSVKLKWTPDDDQANGKSELAGPSIFTALQEQLGLKLVAHKAPVEYLVVQHAEKMPAEN